MKKLSVVVPFRDRDEHLKQFIPHMEKWLTDEEIPFEIIIVNQTSDKGFNRAKLLNIGFKETDNCDYHVFHDVDMLPEDSDYDYTDGPTHLASQAEQFDYKLPYDGYFGGVTIFDKPSFLKINGYSNDYWGWGAEDDDVLYRCSIMNIPIYRKQCRYRSLDHERHIEHAPYMKNIDRLNRFIGSATPESIMNDGLSTLKYTKTEDKMLTDHTRFITVKI
jgi:glycosyltransferase involved in cell wall biosynthesis